MASVNKPKDSKFETSDSNFENSDSKFETSERTSETSETQNNDLIETDDELSVGSPDTDQDREQKSTTAALRIMRKRKNSEKSEKSEDSDTEKPLDFCTKKEDPEYFLPFKKLEMTENSLFKKQAELKIQQQQQQQNSITAKKRGVAGFSIDDILSHKTAALQQEKQQKEQLQPIVRPWDIVAAASANALNAHSGAHSTSPNSSGNSGAPSNFSRKQNKQNQGDSSPLDALFQMASKTFEGLKAKSGKLRTFVFYFGLYTV